MRFTSLSFIFSGLRGSLRDHCQHRQDIIIVEMKLSSSLVVIAALMHHPLLIVALAEHTIVPNTSTVSLDLAYTLSNTTYTHQPATMRPEHHHPKPRHCHPGRPRQEELKIARLVVDSHFISGCSSGHRPRL
jgi:hypothetical protein